MIQGVNKNESEKAYREIYLDSSSSLKDFSFDRKKYYRKYILNEEVEEKDTQASLMGRLVETLLMEPELFDKRFYMSACASPPTGLMLAFVEALYECTKEATNESGEVTKHFNEISKEAYVKSGYKIPYERVIKSFEGTDNEIYYNEILQVRSQGLDVATPKDVTNAEIIVEELKNNFVTKEWATLVDSSRYTVKNQLQVEGYTVDGHLFKSMMDKVVFDHVEKTIQVDDLKCVWAVEGFYEEYYLYRRAYIQAFLYWKAAHFISSDINSPGYGYKVNFPRFVVCDSVNYYNPLIYTLSQEDMDKAYSGFEYKGRKYPGVKELITNLQWALEHNIWNMSRESYLSNGIIQLVKN